MDETGMSEADKVEFVDDVLRTWGEEAARELAARYEVDLDALTRAPEGGADGGSGPVPTRHSH